MRIVCIIVCMFLVGCASAKFDYYDDGRLKEVKTMGNIDAKGKDVSVNTNVTIFQDVVSINAIKD